MSEFEIYKNNIMDIIVGYTGFVGSNLCVSHKFDFEFNSKNIGDAFGLEPDLLVYAGIRAEKFLANSNPKMDLDSIHVAINNIIRIKPRKIVLISTIDVYSNPKDVDESSAIDENNLTAYGINRLFLEKWVMNNFEDYLIVRLPALFGINIKKNFIYDFLNPIPSILSEEKFIELRLKSDRIGNSYIKENNSFYKLSETCNLELLEIELKKAGFSSLSFTDSRSVFQFYPLNYLWNHIKLARENKIYILNLAVEPISINELYQYLAKDEFKNEIKSIYPVYDFKTIYAHLFNGKNGYIFDKKFILSELCDFVRR